MEFKDLIFQAWKDMEFNLIPGHFSYGLSLICIYSIYRKEYSQLVDGNPYGDLGRQRGL